MSITIRLEDLGVGVVLGLVSYSAYKVFKKTYNFFETHAQNTEQIKKLTQDSNTFKNYINMLNRLDSNGLMGSSSCSTICYSEIPYTGPEPEPEPQVGWFQSTRTPPTPPTFISETYANSQIEKAKILKTHNDLINKEIEEDNNDVQIDMDNLKEMIEIKDQLLKVSA